MTQYTCTVDFRHKSKTVTHVGLYLKTNFYLRTHINHPKEAAKGSLSNNDNDGYKNVT